MLMSGGSDSSGGRDPFLRRRSVADSVPVANPQYRQGLSAGAVLTVCREGATCGTPTAE